MPYFLRHLLINECSLIDHTKAEERNEVYISKLALAVGRGILRPKLENERSIQDRHPTSKLHVLLRRATYSPFDPSVVRGPYPTLRPIVATDACEEETRIGAEDPPEEANGYDRHADEA